MPAVGDKITRGNRVYRYEDDGSGIDAYRPHSGWGKRYEDTSLAAAKAQVPLDESIEENAVILVDTTAEIVYIYTLKSTGYDSTFDLSYDLLFASNVTYINDSTISTVLASIDISSLSGMTSTSAQVETAITNEADNTTKLSGVTGSTLSNAVSNRHTQNTDTGTSGTTFAVNSGSGTKKATFDTTNQTANVTIDTDDLNDRVDANEFGLKLESFTIAQVTSGHGGWSSPKAIHVSDIESGQGWLMIWDGTDCISDKYLLQISGSTWASSPSVGDVIRYNGASYECIDATANEEVFRRTDMYNVVVKTSDDTLTADQVSGNSLVTNEGAGASVTLTLPAGVDGYHVIFSKITDQDFLIEANGADSINDGTAGKKYKDVTSETNVMTELIYCNGNWQIGTESGTWANDNS